jgi:hypothetical protein
MISKFAIKRPCDNCPFRKDVHFYLRPGRWREIVDSLLHDQTFVCHKTIDYGEWEEEGEFVPDNHNLHCAGALIMLHRSGHLLDNYLFRLAIMLEMLDPEELDKECDVITLDEAKEYGKKDLDN